MSHKRLSSAEVQLSTEKMAELQSKQWNTLKIFFRCALALAGIWLTLHYLFKWFHLSLDETFMCGFLLFHAFFATIIYFNFKGWLQGKLAIQQIKALFRQALIIAMIGNGTVVGALISLSYLTSFILGDKLVVLSPMLFTVLLVGAMYQGIPLSLRQHVKQVWRSNPPTPLDSETTEMESLDTNPDSFDPENPFGRMNPASPNYLYRSDRFL